MSFISLSFLGVYFPIILFLYYNPIFKSNKFRKLVLLASSIVLYAFVEPVFVFILLFEILTNYLLVHRSSVSHNNVYRIMAVILDISILLFFKYINLFTTTAILFPIGISYFTFKSISYVIDSGKKKESNIVDVVIYISNFLTILSGPLSFFEDEIDSIRDRKNSNISVMIEGFERLMIGLAKKILIADSLSILVDECFSTSAPSVFLAWIGAITYTLQLYYDFSGYTDMALGIGKLFGFTLPENFNYPYMATSVSDYWKRWHMSLTKWFTRYIYIPLGGSKVKSSLRHVINLLIVWIVTGIWHGSNLTFLVWAIIYFLFQLLEKYTGLVDILSRYHLGRIYTLLIVVIEWVVFRSVDMGAALGYISNMFGMSGNCLMTKVEISMVGQFIIPLVAGLVFATGIGNVLRDFAKKSGIGGMIYYLTLVVMFVMCITILVSNGYSAPLYAGF